MNQPDCTHKSAFCTMRFQSKDRQYDEVVWNSADQAVPKTIPAMRPKGEKPVELYHVDAHRDEFRPAYQPRIGTRIFVAPPEDAEKPEAQLVIVTEALAAQFKKGAK